MVFIDRPVALYLKAHVGPGLEGFFKAITWLGEGGVWIAAALISFAVFRVAAGRLPDRHARQRLADRAWSALFMLAAVCGSGLLGIAIKVSLGRLRPRYFFDSGLYGFEPFNFQWGMNSFPSGHSQAIWSAMVALMIIRPGRHAAYVTVAILVSLSRVVTTVHYVSDVVMGTYIGIVATMWIKGYFERVGGPVRLP